MVTRKTQSEEKIPSPARPTTWATTPKTANGTARTTHSSITMSIS